MPDAIESPLELNPEQRNTYVEAKVVRFRERYDALVTETGLMHVALLSTPAGHISIPLLVLPKNPGSFKTDEKKPAAR